MSRLLYNITLTVTLEAPYLIHGNDPGRHGLDATLLRDHQDRPILPGTLLQGRIVECWKNLGEQLSDANPKEWFGVASPKGSNNAPARGRLHVQDLVLKTISDAEFNPKEPRYPFDTTRIALDDERGAVKSNALLNIEQLCEAGAELKFSGDWQVWAEDSEIMLLKQQIHAALLLQTQLGAYRSVGFGRLNNVTVKHDKVEAPIQVDPSDVQRRRLALSFDDPICVNARSRRGNVFESGDVIPGGAIFGALADMLKARHGVDMLDDVMCYRKHPDYLLAKHFNQLRCTHALPSFCGGKRPLPLPKSLVKCDGGFWDAFRHSSTPAWLKSAPAFQTDWKDQDFGEAGDTQGWPQLKHHLRLRTAIEGGQAKKGGTTPDGEAWDKGSLFAYDCVYAARDEDGNLKSNWQFDLYLPASALDKDGKAISDVDRQTIDKSLASLLEMGLAPIGKTGASAKVSTVASNAAQDQWPSHSDYWRQGNLVPVLLVSDALLCTTDALLGGAALINVYQASFSELVKTALNHNIDKKAAMPAIELSHFFATQKLQGGGYLSRRFPADKSSLSKALVTNIKLAFGLGKRSYQPMVLTEAGSVFVFKVNDPIKAKIVFDHWRENGLPPGTGDNSCLRQHLEQKSVSAE